MNWPQLLAILYHEIHSVPLVWQELLWRYHAVKLQSGSRRQVDVLGHDIRAIPSLQSARFLAHFVTHGRELFELTSFALNGLENTAALILNFFVHIPINDLARRVPTTVASDRSLRQRRAQLFLVQKSPLLNLVCRMQHFYKVLICLLLWLDMQQILILCFSFALGRNFAMQSHQFFVSQVVLL